MNLIRIPFAIIIAISVAAPVLAQDSSPCPHQKILQNGTLHIYSTRTCTLSGETCVTGPSPQLKAYDHEVKTGCMFDEGSCRCVNQDQPIAGSGGDPEPYKIWPDQPVFSNHLPAFADCGADVDGNKIYFRVFQVNANGNTYRFCVQLKRAPLDSVPGEGEVYGMEEGIRYNGVDYPFLLAGNSIEPVAMVVPVGPAGAIQQVVVQN